MYHYYALALTVFSRGILVFFFLGGTQRPKDIIIIFFFAESVFVRFIQC